jgi:cell migration-inducing and hyaluronan-binding protein
MWDSVPPEGSNVMRRQSWLHLISWLFPGSLLLGAGAAASAQEGHMHTAVEADAGAPSAAVRKLLWSDPASWPDGKVPGKGDAVTIAKDMDVVLDVTPPALRSLTIDGKLSFSDKTDIGLETDWIYLRRGTLQIGSEAKPYTHNATITLTDTVPDENINTMGDRGILSMGGTLELHGDRTNTWAKLVRTAKAGGTKIEVSNAAGWRKGDAIVRKAELAVDGQAAQRRRAHVEDDVLLAPDRYRGPVAGDLAIRP